MGSSPTWGTKLMKKKTTEEVPQVGQFTSHIQHLEEMIKAHRLEIVRLEQRNDALQSALSTLVFMTRDLQATNPKFLERHHILEGLFLAK